MKYINTTRDKTVAEYARIEPSFDGATCVISVRNAVPVVAGQPIPMVNAKVRVVVPSVITSCNPAVCDSSVNESFTLDFNVKRGADVTAIRAEALRILNVAITEYQLHNGVVPPATADFANA